MFLFVLNSDSFVSSSVQITRVRQKQARLRRVEGGRAWGTSCHSTHSRSLKISTPSAFPSCPPQIPVFSDSICCGIHHTPLLSLGPGKTASEKMHSFRLHKAQLGKWLAVSESSHDRTHEHLTHPCPFPPLSHPCSWLTCLTHCWPIERPGLSGFGLCLCPCLAQFLSVYACLYPHRPRRHKCLATQNYRQKRW